MIQVYNKIYNGKIMTEISYYFLLNVRGAKKYYEVVYEMLSDAGYEFSRYTVTLKGKINNTAKIENDVYRYTPVLFSETKAHRRLSILAKFILFVIAVVNNTSIYKLPEVVTYYHNGVELQLSTNAFIKTAYELFPFFEKVYKG